MIYEDIKPKMRGRWAERDGVRCWEREHTRLVADKDRDFANVQYATATLC